MEFQIPRSAAPMFRQAPTCQCKPTRVDRHTRGWWHAGFAVVLALLAGCTPIPYLPDEAAPDSSIEVVADAADPQIEAQRSLPEQAPPEVTPPKPESLARQLQPPRPRVLVLRSSDAENYREVATALAGRLSDRYSLHEIDLSEPGIREAATQADPSAWSAAIAIGEDAARFAAAELEVFTVFCQIFDFAPLLESSDYLFGVEPLPPLKLQLQSWRQISPDATTIGLIVGEHEAGLIEQAQAAATDLGLELRAAQAGTDQDAIYQFKRFAQSVDGLWLYPSRAILSPASIQEILDYALTHGVQTIVFNKALLDWGALLSVGSNTEDVAAAAADLLDDLVGGNSASISRMKPLTTVETHLNEDIAQKLGVTGSPAGDDRNELLTAIENDS